MMTGIEFIMFYSVYIFAQTRICFSLCVWQLQGSGIRRFMTTKHGQLMTSRSEKEKF